MTDNLPVSSNTVADMLTDAHNDSAKADFVAARINIQTVLQDGLAAVQELSVLASASQDPKFYKALGSMINTVTKASKELLDLQQKLRNIDHTDKLTNDEAKPSKKSGPNITNNLFVGSTADLQRIIGENQMKMITGPVKDE